MKRSLYLNVWSLPHLHKIGTIFIIITSDLNTRSRVIDFFIDVDNQCRELYEFKYKKLEIAIVKENFWYLRYMEHSKKF